MNASTSFSPRESQYRSRYGCCFVTLGLIAATFCVACDRGDPPDVRYLAALETKPRGDAPNAQTRLLSTAADGAKTYVVVLAEGDEVMTALGDFVKREKVTSAVFHGIGAVREPEVAWFDPERKQYKALTIQKQLEVLTLTGDAALDAQGKPTVHAHVTLGTSEARTLGGHLIHAITSPNLELFVTSYPATLKKRAVPGKGFERIDPTLSQD